VFLLDTECCEAVSGWDRSGVMLNCDRCAVFLLDTECCEAVSGWDRSGGNVEVGSQQVGKTVSILGWVGLG
jgi:hypothetical protein